MPLVKFNLTSKNNIMEVERRNGKVYLKFVDGEIEYTEEEFLASQKSNELMKRYLELSAEYAKDGHWTIGNLPPEFDSTIKIDLLIEELQKMFQQLVDEKKWSVKEIDEIKKILVSLADKDISNPLKQGKRALNEYWLKSILAIHVDAELANDDIQTKQTCFTNTFDTTEVSAIYKHFKTGLVEKKYLTETELDTYLKAAFEIRIPPEQRFKIKDAPKKAAIEAVFYTYYKNVAGKPHGKQKVYAALLGDYFEGYNTKSVSTNFSKSVY
jgi:hypothetical protein